MTQRRFFFIFIIRSKGRTFQAGCLGCAGGLSARIVSRGHPESLT
jgi:hypothetical protein